MITNKNNVNKGQCRESVRHFLERHSAARVSGEAYTSYEFAQYDTADLYEPPPKVELNPDDSGFAMNEPDVLTEANIAYLELLGALSDDEHARIIQCRESVAGDKWLDRRNKSMKAHHSSQWACRQSISPAGKFAEIAVDYKCIQIRAMLELARLCGELNGGPIFRSPVVVNKDPLTQEKDTTETADLTYTTHPVMETYGHLLERDWDKDLPQVVRTAFHIAAQFVEQKTKHFAAVTLNIGDLLLNDPKHKDKDRAQLVTLMTDRIRYAMKIGRLPRMDMIYGLEMYPHPHMHILAFAHSEESLAPYEAVFKSVGGKYDPTKEGAAVKTRKQLKIKDGYGFERALGWTNYSRKQSKTLYEARHIVQAGKALYLQVRAFLGLTPASVIP